MYQSERLPKVIRKLNNVNQCREECLQDAKCKHFTFKKAKRKRNNKCSIWYTEITGTKFSRKSTSGSVNGDCRTANLDQMDDCECSPTFQSGQNGGQDLSIVDLLGKTN